VAEQKSADRSCELLRFVQAGSGPAATVAPFAGGGSARHRRSLCELAIAK
jgi:hypothetical protein